MQETPGGEFIPVEISEFDVIEAMKSIEGYIDITPGDFKEVYRAAYTLAINRLLDSMTAGKIMSKPVLFVEQEMALVNAAHMLAEKQISGGPVVDSEGRVVGVVSEKDFLKEMGFGRNSLLYADCYALLKQQKLHDRQVTQQDSGRYYDQTADNRRCGDYHRRHFHSFC